MHFICLSVGSLYGFTGGYLRFCPEISPPVGFMPQLIPPTGRYLMTVVYRMLTELLLIPFLKHMVRYPVGLKILMDGNAFRYTF